MTAFYFILRSICDLYEFGYLACMCLCTMCAKCPKRSEEVSDPLGLYLQAFVSLHVGSGNGTWDLRKNS